MELESKILSTEILQYLYDNGKTLATAESCTGGRIAETIIASPGASNYFKGGIVSYSDDIKVSLLGVDAEVIAQHTAVCEEVAIQMVKGACKALQADYAISATGVAGPGGATPDTPVGTIWIGYGSADDVHTLKLTEDNGRDLNIAHATNTALRLFLEYYREKNPVLSDDEASSK